jgi:hypothetical protein
MLSHQLSGVVFTPNCGSSGFILTSSVECENGNIVIFQKKLTANSLCALAIYDVSNIKLIMLHSTWSNESE